MGVDYLFKDLLELLFPHMEINLRQKEIFRLAPVHKPQILRKDFIEQEASQRGLHDSAYLFPLGICLCHPHPDPGMEGAGPVLICEDGFVYVLVKSSLSNRPGSFLGQVINPEHHVL